MSQRRKRRMVEDEEEEEDQPTPAIGRRASGRGRRVSSSQKTKKARRSTGDDGDDDNEGTQGKATKWGALSSEEREKLVGDFMRYVLFQDHNKHPTRRNDINSKVLHDYKGLGANLIAEAQKRFKDIFGFELVEAPKVTVAVINEKGKAPKAKSREGPSGVFILRNMLIPEPGKTDIAPRVLPQYGLLMVVLGLIHLNEGVIDSETLSGHLKNLGLQEGMGDPVLGDWKKLLETWVKELYLHKTKNGVSASGSPLFDYRKGPRALVEISTKEVMAFVASLYGDELDPIHAKEVEATEKPRKDKEKEADDEEEEEEDSSDSLESESD